MTLLVSRPARGLASRLGLALLFVPLALGCARLAPGRSFPEETADGLARVHATRLGAAYVRPGAHFDAYRAIRVLPVLVAFDPDWDREHRMRITPAERERIRLEVSKRMTEELRAAIASGGSFTVAEQNGPEVMVLRAELRDLVLSATGDAEVGRVDVYALETSRATLHAELQDAESRALLVRVIDRERGRQRLAPFLWRGSTLQSYAELERAMRGWSRELLDVLAEARKGSPPA